MIKVAVVEDEENEIAVLGEGLKRYFGECAEEYELSVFRNGMEFLDAFRGGYDIILMDIEMPMLDGFRTAQRIREADDEVSIIFVTNMANYALKGYEVNAVGFMVKPVGYFALKRNLSRALSRIRLRTRLKAVNITVVTRGGVKVVPSEVVLSSTWNLELIERLGEMVGEDGLALKVVGWYAPAVNIHRNAFAGRNYEYFSEDPLLSGKAAAAEVTGAQSKGMYVYVKHFALNDQETNRIGVATFAYEQAIRELYLEPFEIAVQEGGARGIMSSFNRIGCTWTGASHALLTDVLREEWGFEGHVVTDFSGLSSSYMRIDVGLKAGNDIWLSTSTMFTTKLNEYKNDPAMATYLCEAVHRMLYTTVHSAAMNPYIVEEGITPKTFEVTPWWETALVVIDVAFGLLAAGSAVMLVLTIKKGKKQQAQ